MSLDDATLVAYVDGELDAKAVQEVEALLERAPEARAKVAAMRDSAALARAALNPVVHETLPDRLVSSARLAATAWAVGASTAPRSSLWDWLRGAGAGFAVAASLVLMLAGVGGGYLLGTAQSGQIAASLAAIDSQNRDLRESAFQDALELKASGAQATWANGAAAQRGEITPVRTFKNMQGLYCREFREVTVIDGVPSTTFGVACRQPEAGWRETFRLIPVGDQSSGI